MNPFPNIIVVLLILKVAQIRRIFSKSNTEKLHFEPWFFSFFLLQNFCLKVVLCDSTQDSIQSLQKFYAQDIRFSDFFCWISKWHFALASRGPFRAKKVEYGGFFTSINNPKPRTIGMFLFFVWHDSLVHSLERT